MCFRKVVDGVVVAIAGVYFDDVLAEGSEEEINSLHAAMNQKFPTYNLGE